MKILQINNNHYRLGGAETVYLNTIELLKEKGHDVISFSRRNSHSLKFGEHEYFINQSNSFFNRFYSSGSATQIKFILEKEKPQLVHIHSLIGGITFSILPVIKKFNIPVVITIHDFRLLCPASHFWNGKAEVCEKCVGGKYYNSFLNNCSPESKLRSAAIATESYLRDYLFPFKKLINSFIFVSNFSQKKFLSSNADIESKSYSIYNFTKNFKQEKKYGNYFLFFGRLQPEKGIMTLLNALKDVPNIKLKIAGDGVLFNTIKDMNLANVELLGYKDKTELEDLITSSSFVVLPSECYENNPMSIVESFSMSKPVIGSDLGGIVELIEEGNNGFKFEPKNVTHLKSVLIKCSETSPVKYHGMAESAFQFADRNFSSDIYYKKLLEVYEKTLQVSP